MLECDYLVIGTGASGMAFADAIVSTTATNTDPPKIIMVDKLPEPGGHWNHAYDFVRLHQAACYYGVASEKLEREGETALYKYEDLSSKSEILSYFRFVMDKLVKTGRVFHYGECTYNYDNWDDIDNQEGVIPIQSFVDKEGISHQVRVKRRVVDATYLKIQVPSTHAPKYKIDTGVECVVPINGINKIPDDKTKKFVIIGSGKTGIDAALHLLDNGVDPANITWVMPRDAWMLNRAWFDPQKMMINYGPILNVADSLRESLLSQEEDGALLRLDKNIWPEKYSCATVEEAEVIKLRSIRNVIRQGRVVSITKTHLVMSGKNGNNDNSQQSKIPYEKGSILVDCSCSGLPPRPEVPIFQGGGTKIVIQPTHLCTVCIGAAMIGYVECHEGFQNDDDKNNAMIPVPYPNCIRSYLRGELLHMRNALMGYSTDPRLESWYNTCRLNIDSHSSMMTLIRMFAGSLYNTYSRLPKYLEANKRHYKNECGGGQEEFEIQTHSPEKLSKLLFSLRVITICFRTFVIVVPVALVFGLRFLLL